MLSPSSFNPGTTKSLDMDNLIDIKNGITSLVSRIDQLLALKRATVSKKDTRMQTQNYMSFIILRSCLLTLAPESPCPHNQNDSLYFCFFFFMHMQTRLHHYNLYFYSLLSFKKKRYNIMILYFSFKKGKTKKKKVIHNV